MQPTDEWYALIASDGIWEFLEPEEVCTLTAKKLRLKGSVLSLASQRARVVKTVLLANGHFAGVTPAIFVIFVDFRGPRSKIPCFSGQNAIYECSPIFVKTTCFRQGTKRPFSKTTVSTTLTKGPKLTECLRGGTDGGAILLHSCGSPDPASCSAMSLSYLKACPLVKETP